MRTRSPDGEPRRSIAAWLARLPGVFSWALASMTRVVLSGFRATRHRWRTSASSRRKDLQKRNRVTLPSLYERYPEVRKHLRRELGLRSIALDEVAGTAVAGYDQRGSDFLPLPPFRSTNWAARWQRLTRAMDRLEVLPPIDVIRFDDRYWVEDGHNRVAAALYGGQVEIDAVVTELRPLGVKGSDRSASLAAVLEHGRELREAGEGRPRRPVGMRAGDRLPPPEIPDRPT
jgi:hypothetical protein